MRGPERAALKMTRDPFATTVADISSRPARADPATRCVTQVGGYVPMTFRSPRARNDAGPRSKAATATRPMRLLHARAMRGGENAVQIRRALVRQALADVRHRRARADAARLLPRLLRLLHAAELAEEHGPVGVRGNEVGILLHELGEGVQRLLPLPRQE